MGESLSRYLWPGLFALLVAGCGEVSRGGDAARPDSRVDQTLADSTVPDRSQTDAKVPDAPVPDLQADQSPPDGVLPDLPAPDLPTPDQGPPDQAIFDQALPDQTEPDRPPPPDQQIPDLGNPDTVQPDLTTPDQGKPDVAFLDMAIPDKAVPDTKAWADATPWPDIIAWPDSKAWPDVTPWPDTQPWPDSCVPLCSGKVCGDADGCGATCMSGSGCYAAPGTWVSIPAGTFQMGSPNSEPCRIIDETQHQVTLTHKFEILATEVTQGQFTAVMGYNPSYFTSCGGSCPVEQVDWYEAAAYANALSSKAGKASCYTCIGSGASVTCSETSAYAGTAIYTCPGYRLPTEAEWEYSYRSGTGTAYYSGGITQCNVSVAEPNADKIGWYGLNSDVSYSGCLSISAGAHCLGAHQVGKKVANAWGLFDMSGNVSEWCHDWYTAYQSSSVIDPVGATGSLRVVRGGTLYDGAVYLRAAHRYHSESPGTQYYGLGFRIARTLNP